MKIRDKIKSVRKSRLDAKLILSIIVIVLFVGLLNSFVMYSYFSRASDRRVIRDTQIVFDNVAGAVNDIFDEVMRYAQSLSVNDDIQSFLETGEDDISTYERYRENKNISDYLTRQQILSKNIESMALISEERSIVWTKIPYWDQYSAEICRNWQEEMSALLESTGYGKTEITTPYTFELLSAGTKTTEYIISILYPIYSMKHNGDRIGSLIINVDANAILNILKENIESFDALSFAPEAGENSISLGNSELASRLGEEEYQLINEEPAQFPAYFCVRTDMGKLLSGVLQTSKVMPFFGLSLSLLLATIALDWILAVLLLIPAILHLTDPVKELTAAIEEIGAGNLAVRTEITTKDEFERLGRELNRMAKRLEDYISRELQTEMEKRDLEYEILVAQINPHFIYNTLNTVIYLAKKERSSDVITITNALIELLQAGLSGGSDKNMTRLSDEMQMIQNYATIQNYRYQDMFVLTVSYPKELGDCKIPRLIVQPIVENALFHGIAPKGLDGEISIDVEETADKYLRIVIADNGIGISPEKMEEINAGRITETGKAHSGIAMGNVRGRLLFLYGEKGTVDIVSEEGEGTIVTVTIPEHTVTR